MSSQQNLPAMYSSDLMTGRGLFTMMGNRSNTPPPYYPSYNNGAPVILDNFQMAYSGGPCSDTTIKSFGSNLNLFGNNFDLEKKQGMQQVVSVSPGSLSPKLDKDNNNAKFVLLQDSNNTVALTESPKLPSPVSPPLLYSSSDVVLNQQAVTAALLSNNSACDLNISPCSSPIGNESDFFSASSIAKMTRSLTVPGDFISSEDCSSSTFDLSQIDLGSFSGRVNENNNTETNSNSSENNTSSSTSNNENKNKESSATTTSTTTSATSSSSSSSSSTTTAKKVQRKTRLCSLTPEEKAERRKRQNRLAASRCRKKKQNTLAELQESSDLVLRANSKLQAEIERLKSTLAMVEKEKIQLRELLNRSNQKDCNNNDNNQSNASSTCCQRLCCL